MKKNTCLLILLLSLCLIVVLFLGDKKTCKKKERKIQSALLPGSCTDTKVQCEAECKGFRCNADCKEGKVCSNIESNCYGSEAECKSTCKGFRCNVSECKQGTTPCTSAELSENKCFLTSTCGTGCKSNIFDRIERGDNIKFQIVNKATNAVLESAQNINNNCGEKWDDVNAHELSTSANAKNPRMWWRFFKRSDSTNKYLIVSDCNTYLQCPTEKSRCIDPYKYKEIFLTDSGAGFASIRVDVVDREKGTCKLWSQNKQGYITVLDGCFSNISFDCYLGAVQDDRGDKQIWRLVPSE